MIRGGLSENGEPLIDLDIVGGNGAGRPVTFLVDTGCDSQMILPPHIIRELALDDTGNANCLHRDYMPAAGLCANRHFWSTL